MNGIQDTANLALADVERLLADTAAKQAAAIVAAVAAQQATDAAAQTSAEQAASNTMTAINTAVDNFDPPPVPASGTVSSTGTVASTGTVTSPIQGGPAPGSLTS